MKISNMKKMKHFREKSSVTGHFRNTRKLIVQDERFKEAVFSSITRSTIRHGLVSHAYE